MVKRGDGSDARCPRLRDVTSVKLHTLMQVGDEAVTHTSVVNGALDARLLLPPSGNSFMILDSFPTFPL